MIAIAARYGLRHRWSKHSTGRQMKREQHKRQQRRMLFLTTSSCLGSVWRWRRQIRFDVSEMMEENKKTVHSWRGTRAQSSKAGSLLEKFTVKWQFYWNSQVIYVVRVCTYSKWPWVPFKAIPPRRKRFKNYIVFVIVYDYSYTVIHPFKVTYGLKGGKWGRVFVHFTNGPILHSWYMIQHLRQVNCKSALLPTAHRSHQARPQLLSQYSCERSSLLCLESPWSPSPKHSECLWSLSRALLSRIVTAVVSRLTWCIKRLTGVSAPTLKCGKRWMPSSSDRVEIVEPSRRMTWKRKNIHRIPRR